MQIGDRKWLDLASVPNGLDWLAFVLGGLGIGFTIWQLMRSKGALRAAAEALDETRGVLMRNQLIAVLPGLELVSDEIDSAMHRDDRESAGASLASFVLRSAEVVALLDVTSSAFADVISELTSAQKVALRARAGLYGSPELTTLEIVEEAATQIRDIGPQIRTLSVMIKNDAQSAGTPLIAKGI